MADKKLRYSIEGKDKSKSAVKSALGNLNQMNKSVTRLQKLFTGALGVGVAIKGFNMLTKAVEKSINAWGEQEKAEITLQKAIKNNPLLTGESSKKLKDFASDLQSVSTVGDEVSLSFMTMLASTGRTEDEIQKLMTAAVDLSAGMGISLDSAVKNLNKTFGGTVGELGELLPGIKNLSKEQLIAGEGIELVAEQFKGMGEAAANSVAGGMEQFKNTWGDLQEQMGRSISGFFSPTVSWLTDITSKWVEAKTALNDYRDAKKLLNEGGSGDTSSEIEILEKGIEAAQEKIYWGTGGRHRTSTQDVQKYQKELALMEERLQILRNIEVQELRIADARDHQARQEAEAEAARLRAEAEKNKWNLEILRQKDKIVKKVEQINRLEILLGDEYDHMAELDKLRVETLKEMEAFGFTLPDPFDNYYSGIEQIIDMFDDLKDKVDEVDTLVTKSGKSLITAGSKLEMELSTSPTPTYSGAGSPGTARGRGYEDLSGPAPASVAASDYRSPLEAMMQDTIGPAMSNLGGRFLTLFTSIENVTKVMDPLGTILQGVFQVLEPVINTILQPLVDALLLVGNTLGMVLVPILNSVAPLFEFLGSLLTWLLPIIKVVTIAIDALSRPVEWVADLFAWFGDILEAIGKSFSNWWYNITHPLKKKKDTSLNIDPFESDAFKRPLMTMDDFDNQLSGLVAESTSTGTTSTGATYNQAQDIKIYINTDYVVGEAGMDEFTLMIRDRLDALNALGV